MSAQKRKELVAYFLEKAQKNYSHDDIKQFAKLLQQYFPKSEFSYSKVKREVESLIHHDLKELIDIGGKLEQNERSFIDSFLAQMSSFQSKIWDELLADGAQTDEIDDTSMRFDPAKNDIDFSSLHELQAKLKHSYNESRVDSDATKSATTSSHKHHVVSADISTQVDHSLTLPQTIMHDVLVPTYNFSSAPIVPPVLEEDPKDVHGRIVFEHSAMEQTKKRLDLMYSQIEDAQTALDKKHRQIAEESGEISIEKKSLDIKEHILLGKITNVHDPRILSLYSHIESQLNKFRHDAHHAKQESAHAQSTHNLLLNDCERVKKTIADLEKHQQHLLEQHALSRKESDDISQEILHKKSVLAGVEHQIKVAHHQLQSLRQEHQSLLHKSHEAASQIDSHQAFLNNSLDKVKELERYYKNKISSLEHSHLQKEKQLELHFQKKVSNLEADQRALESRYKDLDAYEKLVTRKREELDTHNFKHADTHQAISEIDRKLEKLSSDLPHSETVKTIKTLMTLAKADAVADPARAKERYAKIKSMYSSLPDDVKRSLHVELLLLFAHIKKKTGDL